MMNSTYYQIDERVQMWELLMCIKAAEAMGLFIKTQGVTNCIHEFEATDGMIFGDKHELL